MGKSDLHKEATEVLKETSRTFFIPISLLTPGLQEAVGAAYLCMRAIDEIEDHPEMDNQLKNKLLIEISRLIKQEDCGEALNSLFQPYEDQLPEVTLRLYDWIMYCPEEIRNKVIEATSIMAEGMAGWAAKNWVIRTEDDLKDYTYYVAGLVGVMLNDIWKWHDGTETDEELAIGFGRGLQAVNILRNYKEDAVREVSFFPDGWTLEEMFDFARKNLELADLYVQNIKNTTILHFCKIPLTLAHSTLEALLEGKEKMSRDEVNKAVEKAIGS